MGNEQSVPNSRRAPHKLSKPRTNTHLSPGLSYVSSPTSRRGSISTTTDSPTKSQYSTVLSDGQAEEEKPRRKRMSLFRSKSSQKSKSNVDLHHGMDRSFVPPGPVYLPHTHRSLQTRQRGNSMPPNPTSEPMLDPQPLMRPAARSQRMSLQHIPYQHNPRLSLVAELPSPDPEIGAALRPKYQKLEIIPRLSELPAENIDSSSSYYGPIRRRSLQTPGLATRPSFAANDPRQSLPSQKRSLDTLQNYGYEEGEIYQYDLANVSSSPLEDLGTLRNNSNFASDGARAKTPGDLDYGHIGAFKLGSLRITNGTASPVSSKGRPSGDDDDDLSHTRNGYANHQRVSSQLAEQPIKAPWIVRSESPLRQHHDLDPLTIDTQFPSPSFALFDFQHENQIETHSPSRCLELAKNYQQDLASSPFSFEASPPITPRLEATSKHTAIEDELFSVEPGTPVLSNRMGHSFDSGYGSLIRPPRNTPGPRDAAPKPLAKADSGYSSNISLRSFKAREGSVPMQDTLSTPSRETRSRVPSSVYSIQPEASEMSIRKSRDGSVPQGDTLSPPSMASRVSSSVYSIKSTTSSELTVQKVRGGAAADEFASRIPSSVYSTYTRASSATTIRYVREGSEPPLETLSTSSHGPPSRAASSTYSVQSEAPLETSFEAKQSWATLPNLPPSREAPPVPPTQELIQSCEKDDRAPTPPEKSTLPASGTQQNIVKHLRQRSLPDSRSGREESPASTTSSNRSSSRKAPTTSSKLSRRPQSFQPQPVYTVQAFHDPSEQLSIPPPTVAAQRSLEQRVDNFPVVSFPNTMVGTNFLRHNASRETLGTIFSVGSMEVKAELNFARLQSALPSVPVEAPIPEHPVAKSASVPKPDASKRNTYHAAAAADAAPVQAPISERRHRWHRMSFRRAISHDRAPPPPQKTREELDQEFEAHLTSFDTIASALGSSPYSVANEMRPKPKKIVNERARSMTAQFEADSAARYAHSMQRNISEASQASTVVHTKKSYTSLTGGNPFSSGITTAVHSRSNSREFPPQAQSNRRSFQNLQAVPVPALQSMVPARVEEIERRHSPANRPQRFGTPPPVSMQTQGRIIPAVASQLYAPISRKPVHQAGPDRTPPAPPAKDSPPSSKTQKGADDQWSGNAEFWAQHRKSAGEALRANSRPSSSGSRVVQGLGIHRAETAAPIMQQRKPIPNINARKSIGADGYAERLRNASGISATSVYSNFDTTQYQPRGNQQAWVDYDYSYGSSENEYSLKSDRAEEAGEYYEAENEEKDEDVMQRIHQRTSSTADMFSLGFEGVYGGIDGGHGQMHSGWGRVDNSEYTRGIGVRG